jgi:hypothetical protein
MEVLLFELQTKMTLLLKQSVFFGYGIYDWLHSKSLAFLPLRFLFCLLFRPCFIVS